MWVMVGWVMGDYLMWVAKIPDQLEPLGLHRDGDDPLFLGHGVPSGRESPGWPGP